jgi:hypothetical protein
MLTPCHITVQSTAQQTTVVREDQRARTAEVLADLELAHLQPIERSEQIIEVVSSCSIARRFLFSLLFPPNPT